MQESWLTRSLDAFVFYSLLAVIALAAIPYGTVQAWWKSVFQCLVFALASLSILARLLQADARLPKLGCHAWQLFLPVIALLVFAFFQTIALPAGTNTGSTVSADVFHTRLFIVHLLALLVVACLLITHTTSQRRLRHLVEVIVTVGVLSSLFGLWRQATQRGPGFLLPGLRPGYGYAQFINSNHFAFLMEMVLGLALGIVVCRGVKGKRLALYLLAAIPMWVALVLANSRGGILSILCQVLFLGLLFGANYQAGESRDSPGAGERSENLASRLRRASRSLVLRGVLVVALLGGAITTVVLVGGDPLAGRVDSIAAELDQKTADSYILRPSIWRATWELIKEHPVAGVGFGGYWIAITKYHAASGEATPQEAHNDYLELLASGGVIGLAIGTWFAVALVITARRKLRATDAAGPLAQYSRAVTLGALAGILTVAIHSLVDFGLHITINAAIFAALIAIVAMKQTGEQTVNQTVNSKGIQRPHFGSRRFGCLLFTVCCLLFPIYSAAS